MNDRQLITIPMDGLAPPDLELFQYTAHIFEFGKIESTVRYLGIEVDDALAIAEQVDV